MDKYFLTKTGKSELFNRTRIFSNAIAFSCTSNLNKDTVKNCTGSDTRLQKINSPHSVKICRIGKRLIFLIEFTEIDFTIDRKSLVIGFQNELSTGESKSDYQGMIYINADNCYAGIIDNDESEDIVPRRLKKGQLKLGVNSIILEDDFDCQILADEDLTEGIEGIDIQEQFKNLYPYYEEI